MSWSMYTWPLNGRDDGQVMIKQWRPHEHEGSLPQRRARLTETKNIHNNFPVCLRNKSKLHCMLPPLETSNSLLHECLPWKNNA